MAKSFKELGKKAESLIEQGHEADKKVSSCQARVASSSSRVAAARRQLAAASETDDEGRPKGNVEQARAQLGVAQNQLAASQRALSSAKEEANRVRQQKNAHIQEIEKHNAVERSNIEKLRRLQSSAFAADSAGLTAGMAERLNQAEDARVSLLKSMGINATAEYITVGGDVGSNITWNGGGFLAIDTSGQIMSYRGGSGEGMTPGGGVPTPIGGALSSTGAGNNWGSGNTDSTNQQVNAEKTILGSKWFGKNTNRKQQKVSTIDFNGLTLENNGMAGDKYFVKGSNYERFSHFWKNYSQYSHDESNYSTTVNSRDIEGIYINNNEAKDPHRFWNRGMVYPEDSELYFSRIAAHIPEVRQRLNSGESVDSIRSNPELAACYDSYFDTPIEVYKIDDYYYFAGSGRHRCMASQKLGLDMPVKVIGQYTSNISTLSDTHDFETLSVYMGAKHGVRLDSSIGNLEIGTVKQALSGLESVVSEYPDVEVLLKEGITSKSGVMSCTGSKLSFNPDYFSDLNTLKSTCLTQSKMHHWIPNSSPQSIGVHEAAHGVEWAIIQANPNYSSREERVIAWNNCSEAKKIVLEACSRVKQTAYGAGKTNSELISSISSYAATTCSEAMAEAFADVSANGDNANPLSKEIKRCTQALMRMYKGGF